MARFKFIPRALCDSDFQVQNKKGRCNRPLEIWITNKLWDVPIGVPKDVRVEDFLTARRRSLIENIIKLEDLRVTVNEDDYTSIIVAFGEIIPASGGKRTFRGAFVSLQGFAKNYF